MDVLIEKSNINERKLYKFLKTISTQELSNLSEPCYYPQFRKYKEDLYKFTGLDKRDLKDFVKRFYKGTKWKSFQLHNDDYSNLLIFIMYYYLTNNNKLGFYSTMLFYNIRQYSNVLHKMLKYCNEEVFKYALDNLSSIHLFKREKTIGNAIYFLTKQYSKNYEKGIKEKDVDKIGKFVQESRHRINQSVKSFAVVYYDTYDKHEGYKRPEEIEGEEIEVPVKRGTVSIEKFVNNIVTYKQYNKKAFEESLKITKIDKNLAIEIVKELSNNKYNENLNIILRLLLNRIKELNILCSNKLDDEIKKLMGIKRSKNKFYFKQQINVLLIDVLKDMNKYNKYNKLNDRNKFLVNSFLAYYISKSFKEFMC